MLLMSHATCFSMPIDQNQIKVHKQNFTDIACNSSTHHCISIGIAAEEENSKYLIYLSNNDGETWDKIVELIKPVGETPNTEQGKELGIHCDKALENCILIGTTYINNNRNIITYHSQDGGMNWSITNLIELPKRAISEHETSSIAPDVRFACDQNGVNCVIATFTISKHPKPLIYTTKDNGYTWTNPLEIKIANLNPYNEDFKLTDINCSISGLNCIFIGNYMTVRIDNDELVADYIQKIFTTEDGGITWNISEYPISVSSSNTQKTVPDKLLKISCDKLGKKCIAIGSGEEQINKQTQNEIYREESSIAIPCAYLSVDGGKSWTRTSKITTEPYISPLVSLSCDSEAESCIAAGLKGYPEDEDKSDAIAYITYDSGYNWQPLPIQPSEKNSVFTKIFCEKSSAICHIVGFDEKYF